MELRSLPLRGRLVLAVAVPVLLASAAWAQATPSNESSASGWSAFASKLGNHEDIVGIGLLPGSQVSTPRLTAEQVEAVKRQVAAPFLLFTDKGHEFVITDTETVNRAFAFVPHQPETPMEREQWVLAGQKAAKAQTKEIEQNLRALVDQSKASGKVKRVS